MPPWRYTDEEDQGGVEPPQSKVLRTPYRRVTVDENFPLML